ncbi:MAG: hypothetical protein ABTQ34_01010 [Bdellovibrionales bacterium]
MASLAKAPNAQATPRGNVVGLASVSTRKIVYAVLGTWLVMAASVNLLGTFTPTARKNEDMIRNVQIVASHLVQLPVLLPTESRTIDPAIWDSLKKIQESALKRSPADPYAWSRLSWLRRKAGDSEQDAFAALRMSDLVSPYEAPQLAERAVTWRSFRNVQTLEQQRYQVALWNKAFMLDDQETLRMAVQNKLTDEVGKALASVNPAAAEDWKSRLNQVQIP